MRGKKLEGCMQLWTWWLPSSMTPVVVLTCAEEDLTRVGLTEQRRERSKSESMMWPSSRTRTFSGFRSL